jgi:hypothetical protein
MRFRLELGAAREDAYAVAACAALAKGAVSWVPLHPCPWRGRYRIGELDLCGRHAGMEEVEVQEERVPTLPDRLGAYRAMTRQEPVPEVVTYRRVRVRR